MYSQPGPRTSSDLECLELPAFGLDFHSILLTVKVRVTIWLAVYLQWIRLGAKPLKAHDQRFFQLSPCGHSPFRFARYSLGADPTENTSSCSRFVRVRCGSCDAPTENIASPSCFIVVWRHCPLPSIVPRISANTLQYFWSYEFYKVRFRFRIQYTGNQG
jgi:hypothetical protein